MRELQQDPGDIVLFPEKCRNIFSR